MANKKQSPADRYMTTREAAEYLCLNEKKIYALVSSGRLPAARISGKWLFTKELIDAWVNENTIYPAEGLIGALIDQLLIFQGSDDWLLSRIIEDVQESFGTAVPMAVVGSMGGLNAVNGGLAHFAGCHVERSEISKTLRGDYAWYLLELFSRTQGLIFDKSRNSGLKKGLKAADGLSLASRQALSGTKKLADKLFHEAGFESGRIPVKCKCRTHLETAFAVSQGLADFGLGIEIAASQYFLSFLPLHQESFFLVIRASYFSNSSIQRLLEALISKLNDASKEDHRGYSFEHCGRLTPLPQRIENPILKEK